MQDNFGEKQEPEKRYNLFDDDVPYVKKQLLRPKNDRIFLGVCSGLAKYYEVSKTLVRLLFAMASILGGLGVVIYFLVFLFTSAESEEGKTNYRIQHKNAKILFGISLIIIGFYSIIFPTNYFPIAFFIYVPMKIIAPIILLIAGVWIQKYYRSRVDENSQHKFQKATNGKLFLGVCAGLAEYFGAYVIVVRLLFVIFAFATMGIGVLLYLLIAYLSKQESVVTIEE